MGSVICGRTFTGGLALAALLALSGCENFEMPNFTARKEQQSPPAETMQPGDSVSLVERDVEAPEVFQVNEPGLWDGRPSLGGVWVAYPGDIEPERVIIRNQENRKFVIGALFKRERISPGPNIQISSEAASALGILAGKPATLNVTALRRETAPVATATTAEPAKTTTTAAAAVKPAAKPTTKTSAEPAETGADTAKTVDTVETAAEKPRKKGLFSFLRPKEKAAGAPADTAPIKESTLGEIASAAIDNAESKQAATAAPAPAAKPAKPASGLEKPFIQIGIFSVEANANNTATSLKTKGVLPIVKAQQSSGKKFWRVLVGPATSSSERAILLKKARELGFADAYFVTN